ncbi:unnamed protein product [Nezara viridula]|uniref:Cytochrome b-c1 complex subunit 8 n=1 Tax=Nezara viridula TaxID=85310 RepID=A0A9P0E8Y7_NEZVI|nr:unnamed protein product [Nezara viridula]
MKLTNPLRHVEFGNLGVFVRGIVSYTLSPFELKAFHNPLKRIPRAMQRFIEGAVHIVPNGGFAWWLHGYVEKKYDEMNRKNPEDYENDS